MAPAAAEVPSLNAIAFVASAAASASVGWRATVAERPGFVGVRPAFITAGAAAELGQAAGTSVAVAN